MGRAVRGRALAVALAAGLVAPAASAHALAPGESVFWEGQGTGTPCGPACHDHPLDVAPGGWRLRVAIDHATDGDVWDVELRTPGGSPLVGFGTGVGLYSNEGFASRPVPGRWTVRVRGETQNVDPRHRLRAALERAPVRPSATVDLLPNLQALPPYELTFAYPVTNGGLSGEEPVGLPLPGGRASCHAEEVAEGAVRCLRMAFGVRNTGQGPMSLHYDGGAAFDDRPLFQRVFRSDGKHFDRDAGKAVYHRTHQHYHHDQAIGLQLLRVTDPAAGTLEPVGDEHRKGFAHRNELLREWRRFYPTGADFGFGLRAGWGDYYEWDRPGNYIDFGLSGDGLYLLRLTADPVAMIAESNEADNVAYTLVEVTGEQVKWLAGGRGASPWDRCRIVMSMGAEPDPAEAGTPLRPADCPPDTVWPGLSAGAAGAVARGPGVAGLRLSGARGSAARRLRSWRCARSRGRACRRTRR